MRNIITAFVLLFITTTTVGQDYQKGIINNIDGSSKKGYLLIPSNSGKDEIKFKPEINSSIETIPSSSLTSVTIISNNGNQYKLEYLTLQMTKKPNKKKSWVLLEQKGFYNLYIVGSGFSMNKDGIFSLTSDYIKNRTLPEYQYYIKKNGEEIANFFAITSSSFTYLGLNGILKSNCKKYLSDYPELVERVTNKEFTPKDTEQIIIQYNQFKAKKG